jgi:hypothetical protein
VVHRAENGEQHVADVKTDHGWVLEFQHSYINPDERRARDAFYQKVVWVVDGVRRKRDRAQLLNAWVEGVLVGSANSPVRKSFSTDCVLLREWAGSHARVFFDFGDEQTLWWLLSKSPDGWAYVAPFSRTTFIDTHRGGATQSARDFDEFVKDVSKLVTNYESHLRAQEAKRASLQLLQGVRRYRRRF